MVNLSGAFSRFRPFRTLVLGDFLLDTYTTGIVKRISPEAPVPIMEVHQEESRPGGAGNVVLNLATLSGQVIAAGRIGPDPYAMQLKQKLSVEGVDCSALLVDPTYQTPRKNRLIAQGQQLLRVDIERIHPPDAAFEEAMIRQLELLMPQVEVLAISDYGKGLLTDRLIQTALLLARKANVRSIVDPKGADFAKYKTAHLLKPNLAEAYAAAKMAPSASLNEVAAALLAQTDVELLLITRSEEGMTLFDRQGGRTDFPARLREVKDVTGAGDTVLAMLCLGLANKLEVSTSIHFANIAAGIAVERLGCAQITLPEIAERLLVLGTV